MTEPVPVLALAAAPGTSARTVPLLGVLGEHARVISWQRRGALAPDAVLATSPDQVALVRGPGGVGPDVPVAVWVRRAEDVEVARSAEAAVLLTGRPELAGDGVVLVPPVAVEVDRWPFTAPLVRARRRLALGLPELHVVKVEGRLDPLGDDHDLSVASAAVVSGPATVPALALGTPVVTSADTARRLGLRPGRDVEVAVGPDAALALAAEVGADDLRAASLSRRARRCAEHHLDLGRPAAAVARALGLVVPGTGGSALADARLAELGTPASSPVRRRVAAALADLPADGRGSAA